MSHRRDSRQAATPVMTGRRAYLATVRDLGAVRRRPGSLGEHGACRSQIGGVVSLRESVEHGFDQARGGGNLALLAIEACQLVAVLARRISPVVPEQ